MRRLAALGSLPGDENWLLDTLSDLGVLWRSPAGWEMGIPSFADYILLSRSGGRLAAWADAVPPSG